MMRTPLEQFDFVAGMVFPFSDAAAKKNLASQEQGQDAHRCG